MTLILLALIVALVAAGTYAALSRMRGILPISFVFAAVAVWLMILARRTAEAGDGFAGVAEAVFGVFAGYAAMLLLTGWALARFTPLGDAPRALRAAIAAAMAGIPPLLLFAFMPR